MTEQERKERLDKFFKIVSRRSLDEFFERIKPMAKALRTEIEASSPSLLEEMCEQARAAGLGDDLDRLNDDDMRSQFFRASALNAIAAVATVVLGGSNVVYSAYLSEILYSLSHASHDDATKALAKQMIANKLSEGDASVFVVGDIDEFARIAKGGDSNIVRRSGRKVPTRR